MTALKQQSVYASAAHVLRTPSMAWLIEGEIDDERQRIGWDTILDARHQLSGGEQALLDIAWTIWRDDPMPINLQNLDDASLERVIEALLALRPLSSFRPATEIANEAIDLFMEALDRLGPDAIDSHFDGRPGTEMARAQAVQEIREGMAVAVREEDIR